jgi:hypothetical protein
MVKAGGEVETRAKQEETTLRRGFSTGEPAPKRCAIRHEETSGPEREGRRDMDRRSNI